MKHLFGAVLILLVVQNGVLAGLPQSDIRATRSRLLENRTLNMRSSVLDLAPKRVRAGQRRSTVRFEQTCAGLPVFASSVVVQLNRKKEIEYLSSDVVHDGQLSHIFSAIDAPIITDLEAIAAIRLDNPTADCWSSPELMVYSPPIVGHVGPPALVWRIETASEMILVNATDKEIVLRYPLQTGLMDRMIYDLHCHRNWDYTNLVRKEGDSEYKAVSDVDLAYRYVGNTYDFFLSHHDRDGLNNEGFPIICLMNYSSDASGQGDCSYFGAFWSQSGRYLAFGPGCVFDDVVAHEYTHGITQHMSGIIYLNESGAINESLSDVWGEFVDQTNGWGNDSEDVKWLIGEDMIVGGFRSMKDPTRDQCPDRMTSPHWRPVSPNPIEDSDYGGVHYNSGVGNKLCYLLTDGDTFNGDTVEGLGIEKVADLYYEIQDGLLVQAPDYGDLYFALKQAAVNLGWTAAERENLENACRAVEIASEYRLYSSADVPQHINDFETASSSLLVEDTGVVSDLNVKIELGHLSVSDLVITLTSPAGTSVRLVDDTAGYTSGYGYGFYGTAFDDEAPFGLEEAYEPFTGSFRPLEPLSTFNGENAQGAWILTIHDQTSLGWGELFGWTMELK